MNFVTFILLLSCLGVSNSYANVVEELDGYLGLVSVNFSEVPSNLDGPNASDPASGTVTSVAASLAYQFYKKEEISAYYGGLVPLVGSGGTGYFSTFVGAEYHFSKVPALILDDSSRIKIEIRPKFRYHLNSEISINYLTYETDTAKKTDLSFGLGVGGGASYMLGKSWGLKLKTMMSKDFGLITDGLAVKIFLGGIFFLE